MHFTWRGWNSNARETLAQSENLRFPGGKIAAILRVYSVSLVAYFCMRSVFFLCFLSENHGKHFRHCGGSSDFAHSPSYSNRRHSQGVFNRNNLYRPRSCCQSHCDMSTRATHPRASFRSWWLFNHPRAGKRNPMSRSFFRRHRLTDFGVFSIAMLYGLDNYGRLREFECWSW